MINPALWLFDQGIPVFPLKERSKEPACFWTTYRGTREQVAGFTNYGVPLGTLAVLDPDSADLVAHVRGGSFEVPDTPFIVKTARGLHLYYRLAPTEAAVPKFVRRHGFSIEFRNRGQYTVGPGSVHPTGAIYTPVDWSWRWEDIPFFPVDTFQFDDGSRAGSLAGSGAEFELPDQVYEPERHEVLNSMILSLVNQYREGMDVDRLRGMLIEQAQLYCENVCSPPLKWDDKMKSFFARSFRGALTKASQPRVEPNAFGGDPWAM